MSLQPPIEVFWGGHFESPEKILEIDVFSGIAVVMVRDREMMLIKKEFVNKPRGRIQWRFKQ